MAALTFNRALGRGAEWIERINANDPATATLILAVLRTAGLETDAVLKDKDDFAALVSGATDFATNGGYTRKTISDTGGLTVTYDDTNDRVDVDAPDQTFTSIVAGDGWSKAVTGWDKSGAGTDSGILPMTLHDAVLTPNGADITFTIANLLRVT